jgi:hypothetical protein
MATIEDMLVEQYYAFAKSAAALIDLTLDPSAEKELRKLIRTGVKKLVKSDGSANSGEISKGAETLLPLIFAMGPQPKGQQTINEIIVIKGWEKRCPGCPPWC